MQTNVLNVKMDGIQVELDVHYVIQWRDVPNVLKRQQHVQNVEQDFICQVENVILVPVKWQIVMNVHKMDQHVLNVKMDGIQVDHHVKHAHQ